MKGTSNQSLLIPATLADKINLIMNSTFKAIQKLKYLKPSPVFVLHLRVKELHPEQTKAAVAFNQKLNADNRPGQISPNNIQSYRTYKCLDCGMTWKEDIHSPMIVNDHSIHVYYKSHISCTQIK